MHCIKVHLLCKYVSVRNTNQFHLEFYLVKYFGGRNLFYFNHKVVKIISGNKLLHDLSKSLSNILCYVIFQLSFLFVFFLFYFFPLLTHLQCFLRGTKLWRLMFSLTEKCFHISLMMHHVRNKIYISSNKYFIMTKT